VKYGEEIIKNFDIDKDLEIWPNKFQKNYKIVYVQEADTLIMLLLNLNIFQTIG